MSITGFAAKLGIDVEPIWSILNAISPNLFRIGTSTILNGISQYDDRWEFQLNSQIVNSLDLALATNAGTTVSIAVAATPVIIAGTWVSEDMHRFTHAAGGRWTYNGKGSHVEITVNISGTAATATHDFTFFVYKNGVQIANSAVTREFTAGANGNVTLIWETALATNDYLEVWVQNDASTANFVLASAKIRIRD